MSASERTVAPGPSAVARPTPTGEACRNCGAALYGEFCYACGQPRVGWVRHVRELAADFVDSVLNIDGRFLRTLVTLFFRPGRMTVDYLAGARGRYASPFRLFFVLCALAFLLVHTIVEIGEDLREDPALLAIETAPTAAAVDRALAEAIAGLATAPPRDAPIVVDIENAPPPTPAADKPQARLREAEERLQARAERRRKWLAERDAAIAEGRAPPRDPSIPTLQFGGTEPWDATRNPIRIDAAPEAVNAALNQRAARLQRAIASARADPEPIIAAIFAKLPLALLVVMPVFAALLKLVHWPRHRLYTEHLVVALHSHAFLFLALVLLSSGALLGEVVASGGAVAWVVDLASRAVLLWMPVYLFLMQKRVYGSRWLRALVEYGVTGMAYLVLLSMAVGLGAVAGLLSL
jgi:hypothetical protein